MPNDFYRSIHHAFHQSSKISPAVADSIGELLQQHGLNESIKQLQEAVAKVKESEAHSRKFKDSSCRSHEDYIHELCRHDCVIDIYHTVCRLNSVDEWKHASRDLIHDKA